MLKDANLAVIYFAVGDLLSWQTMLLQESFENWMSYVLRMMGDVAACVSSYS